MMEFIGMSSNFPSTIFKGASIKETSNGLASGQNVVCTPEVSLYQYNGNEINGIVQKRPPMQHLDEKVIGEGDVEIIGHGSSPSVFECAYCGKTFQQKNTFQNHLRSHREGDDPYQCDICGKTFAVPARLTRHYRTHTGEKPYQCEYCNKSFSVKENLSVHRRIHTKERPYKCEVCERAFEHSGKLHRHMRIHTGERPHRCQICQKTFIQSGQLVIHMRTHTGEKPYVCKVCNKGFTCSKQLKVHTRTHTGEKPYTCDICGKSFGYNHVLKLHQVAHYGEKVYKCTLCNSTFNSKKSLETHIKTHSSDSSASSQTQSMGDSLEPPTSQTPQNSDKENRESSDSEISLQNSPTPTELPRSPSSPMYNSPPPTNFKIIPNTNSDGMYSSSGNRVTQQLNLPYPMLPPGVQVHQAPQSRTTFLYVTSKLPTHPNLNATILANMPPTSEPSTRNSVSSTGNPSFKSRMSGKPYSAGIGLSRDTPYSSSPDMDKFLESATIREQVLASIEKFGYGIPNSSTISDNSNNSNSSNVSKIEYSTTMNNCSTAYNPGNRSKLDFFGNMSLSGRERDNSVSDETSDNFTGVSKRQFFKSEMNESYYNPYSRPAYSRSGRASSPDTFGSKYSSGRVLALALTRGSKAVAKQLPLSISLTPVNLGQHSPPRRNSESPAELCIDFSRRSGSVSPRNSVTSPTPSTASRSTPGLSESAEDLSDEYSSSNGNRYRVEPKKSPEMNKHGKVGLVSFAPRKRSSLILEKYAQENHPSSPMQMTTESILAQRLRLSSVIQYAEKCT